LRCAIATTIMVAIAGCGGRGSQNSPPETAAIVSRDKDKKSYSRAAEEAVEKVLKGDRLWFVLGRPLSHMEKVPEWGPLQEVVDAAGVEVLVKPLIKGLHNRDGRMSAVLALGRIGPKAMPAIPALLELYAELHDDERQNIVNALGEIGANSPEVIDVLTQAVTHDNSKYVRASAAYSLGIIGVSSDDVTAALLDGLHDDYKCVRFESAAALGRLGRTSDDILIALQKAFDDSDRGVAVTAVWALGQLGPLARPALEKAVNSEKRHVRLKAEEVLRNIRSNAKERETKRSTQQTDAPDAKRRW